MIKGNESDVWNIDFEIPAYRGDKFLCLTLFFDLEIIVHISTTRCPIEMGFGPGGALPYVGGYQVRVNRPPFFMPTLHPMTPFFYSVHTQ